MTPPCLDLAAAKDEPRDAAARVLLQRPVEDALGSQGAGMSSSGTAIEQHKSRGRARPVV